MVDLSGERFGKLTVERRKGPINGGVEWFCRCDCGNLTIATGQGLKRGSWVSCGCSKKERAAEHFRKQKSFSEVRAPRQPITRRKGPEVQA